MVLGVAPQAARGGGADPPPVIELLSFAPLDGYAAFQTVPLGTEERELELPDVLYAGVATPTDLPASPTDAPPDRREPFTTYVPVTWTSEPEFDGFEPGVYIFTATPGDGFLPGYGVFAPQIAVAVLEPLFAALNNFSKKHSKKHLKKYCNSFTLLL